MDPFVTCICPTYRRTRLLSNSIACYLAQTYQPDRRELLILDDSGQLPSKKYDGGYEVIGVQRRFNNLPAKYSALASLADDKSDVIALWDDDDIYLPWHIEGHVQAILSANREQVASKPSTVLSTYKNRLHREDGSGRFYCSMAFTRKAMESAGGWPPNRRADFDHQFILRISAVGVVDPVAFAHPSYVFRWTSTGNFHTQHVIKGPSDTEWYARCAGLGKDEIVDIGNPEFDEETRIVYANPRGEYDIKVKK